jgi:hypothetical protein
MRHVNGSARGPGRLVSGGPASRRLRPWFRGRPILAATGRPIRLPSRRGAAGGLLAAGLFQRDLLLDGLLFSRGLLISLWLIGGLVPVRLLGRRALVCRLLVRRLLVCRLLVGRAALSRLRVGRPAAGGLVTIGLPGRRVRRAYPAGGRFSEPGPRGPNLSEPGLSEPGLRGPGLRGPGLWAFGLGGNLLSGLTLSRPGVS